MSGTDTHPSPRRRGPSLGASGLLYAVGTFGARGISLAMLPVFGWYLTPAQFARVNLAETIAALVGVFAGGSLSAAAGRLVFTPGAAADPSKQDRVISTIAWTGAALGAFTLIAFALGGPSLIATAIPGFAVPVLPHVAVAVVAAVAAQWVQIPLTWLRTQKRAWAFVAVSFGQTALAAALTITALTWVARSSIAVLVARMIAAAVVVAVSAWLIRAQLRAPVDRSTAREALAFALPLLPHQLVAFALAAADRLILERYRPDSEVGLYAIAYSAGMVMSAVTSAVMLAWGPEFHRVALESDGRRTIAHSGSLLIAMLAGTCAVGCILADPAMRWLFPPEYAGARPLVAPILCGYFFHAVFSVLHLALLQAQRTRLLALVTIGAAVVNVALNLLVVPHLGAEGSAWATLAAYGFEALVIIIPAQRSFFVPYPTGNVLLAVAAIAPPLLASQAGRWEWTVLAAIVSCALLLVSVGRDARVVLARMLRRTNA